jgi:DNA primase
MRNPKHSHSQSFLTMNLEIEVKELFSKYGIQIHAESGNEVTIYCPFHKNRNTPSFYLNKKTGLWQCFNPSCGEKGNFKKLYRQITGKSYGRQTVLDPTALKNELDRALRPPVAEQELSLDNVIIDYEDSSKTSKLTPFIERGLSLDTLEHFEIGFSENKNRIVVPVRNPQYKLVGLIGRAIESEQEPRYLYNTGFKRALVLFNIQNAKHHPDVIIVEGSVDAMKVHEAGFPNVVATLGAQVSAQQVSMLKKYFDKIIIFSDNDEAGNAMRDAIINSCCGKELYTASISDGLKDPGEMSVKQIQDSINNKQIII